MHIDLLMCIIFFLLIFSHWLLVDLVLPTSPPAVSESPPRREPRLLQEANAPGCLKDFVGMKSLPILSRDFFISQVFLFVFRGSCGSGKVLIGF